MNYTMEERIAYLEEMVAMQSEQINRLQQCVNAMVEYSNLSDDRQSEIVNVLCGDNNEFIVNPKPLFPIDNEKKENAFDKFGEDDQDALRLFFSVIDKEEQEEEQDKNNEFGDIALTFEELEKKYGKLTFSEEHKDFYDADGFVRRICNISHNEFFASNMAKGEINVNNTDSLYRKLMLDEM
jgi:uncharacterized coiled-coil protein SlyX